MFGSAALTRNEAKSMSTRLLAGESFAIFQIKAELSLLRLQKQPLLEHLRETSAGKSGQRPSRIPLCGIRLLAVNAGLALLHVEVAAAGSLSARSQLVPLEASQTESTHFRRRVSA